MDLSDDNAAALREALRSSTDAVRRVVPLALHWSLSTTTTCSWRDYTGALGQLRAWAVHCMQLRLYLRP
ncbi:hypothetical protein [Plantibacter sp. VKM Ac-2885]|uniref:hypothetical protein n=1 Tax=Plantibacter sp. VKM Ac-2885 TaxID=2783828 RepID=UPI00351C7367